MRWFIIAIPLFVMLGLSVDGYTLVLDERWVCNIKKSCLDCLRLPHCSWCGEQNKCFSKELPEKEDFCKDNATHHTDYGMSLADNAECACVGDQIQSNCYPPDVSEGPQCSNRGKCVCGRCVCDQNPDPQHPTKVIVGEHCEFDNFSCDGPRCNEGPYSINQLSPIEDEQDIIKGRNNVVV